MDNYCAFEASMPSGPWSKGDIYQRTQVINLLLMHGPDGLLVKSEIFNIFLLLALVSHSLGSFGYFSMCDIDPSHRSRDRLVGLVVKVSAPRAQDPGSNPA